MGVSVNSINKIYEINHKEFKELLGIKKDELITNIDLNRPDDYDKDILFPFKDDSVIFIHTNK